MQPNSNPANKPAAYQPLTSKQKFFREFLFFLPSHSGVFQLLTDRNGRDYVSRCIGGVWQYDYAIEEVGETFITLSKDGDITKFLFDELQFALA